MRRSIIHGFAGLALLCATLATADPAQQLVDAARERTLRSEIYDGSYQRIGYPLGDVAQDRGVCTDLVIRSYRRLGIDLQVLVHEDMRAHFGAYPALWGLRAPDRNIDHRRVPNLQTYFSRAGGALAMPVRIQALRPGDLLTWMLPGNLPHIGIVSDQRSADGERPLILHNIGAGPVEEDMLSRYPITGHYRYMPPAPEPR